MNESGVRMTLSDMDPSTFLDFTALMYSLEEAAHRLWIHTGGDT